MALSIAQGSFNIGTGAAGTTVTITPGFQAKAGLLWWSGRTEAVDAAGSANMSRGIGMFTPTAFRAMANFDQDGVGTSVAGHANRNDACILQVDGAAMVGWADVQSVSATQVVFEILDAFTIDLRISYLILGGSDLDAEIVTFATGAVLGNQTTPTTNVPKLLVLISEGTPANTFATTGNGLTLGMAASSTQEYCWSGGAITLGTSGNTGSYCRGGECHARWSTTAILARAELVSFNSGPNGFTLNWLEQDVTAPPIYALVLSGSLQVHLGDFVTLAALGTITETGIPFQPQALLFVSHNKAQSTINVEQVNSELSLGVALDTTNRMVQQASSRDGNTTMFVQTAIQYDEVYVNMSVSGDTIEGSADLASLTADGFTLDMDVADPAASFVWYAALAAGGGPPPAGGGPDYEKTVLGGKSTFEGSGGLGNTWE